jgi:uncharacterized protein (TIRG00374 family)
VGESIQASGPAPSPAPPDTGAASRRSRLMRWAVLVGIAAFVVLFAFADLRELWRVFAQADRRLLLLSFLWALASYAAMARSYQGIAAAAGADIPFTEMFKITIVACTVNYLLSTGGLSGFALRMYFFTRRGIASGTALLISLAQTVMTNFTLLAFVLAGCLYLYSAHPLRGYALVVVAALLVLVVAAAIIAAFLLLRARWRRRTLFYLAQSAHWVMHRVLPHRTPPRTHIWRYQFNLNRGIEFLLSQKRQMVAPFFFILLDWVFTILILHTAFLALHFPVRLSFVVVGFAVGITLSYTTLIPGGLGIMEGSMAAIFAGLGVPYETAIVAALVYRCAYYVMPLIISLFFHRMFTQGRQAGVGLQRGELSPYEAQPAEPARSATKSPRSNR